MIPRDRIGRTSHSEGTSEENSLETTRSQQEQGAQVTTSFSTLSDGALCSLPSSLQGGHPFRFVLQVIQCIASFLFEVFMAGSFHCSW